MVILICVFDVGMRVSRLRANGIIANGEDAEG